MLINENEYILKAKDVNIEIHKETKKQDKIIFIVLVIFLIVISLFTMPLLLALAISLIMILAIIELYKYGKWDLIIKDKKVCILNYGFLNYEIDYENLINCKCKTQQDYDSRKKSYYLEIEYVKDNKFKILDLPYPIEMQPMISEVCNCFITNKELTRYQYINEDYLDIRDNELDEIIMTKKEKENKLKNIVVIIGIIIFLIMFISSMFIGK